MELGALCLILASVFVWGAFSARAAAISTPIFFVATGLVMSEGLKLFEVESDPHVIKVVAEVTLVWVLFADASRVRIADLRADEGRYARLLGLGLPMTVALGAVAAIVVLGVDPWYALLLGAALAPTDAALGSAVMSDRRLPRRVRHTLNVESGLNDGIATPIVTVAIVGIATQSGLQSEDAGSAVIGLLLGVAVGMAAGAGGGALLRIARRRGWSSDEFAGPAVLALALLAYLGAVALDANGFVAAFVGGSAYSAYVGRGGEKEVYYVEQTCGLASMIAWFVFGSVIVPTLAAHWTWQVVVYAVLSLTVIRMLPVALALIGSHMDSKTVLFIGWFGPRGLASIVFALIALEDLHGAPGPINEVVGAIGFTILLSVLAHGLSARPLAGRYAASRTEGPDRESQHPEPTVRRLVSQTKGGSRSWSRGRESLPASDQEP
ncbi:MAG TPA: cation:proton antiporter [Propionibacteriaceae bacterium]|nr:cation:proton antiporter [Propionibacteriaceae bacterium]